MAASVAPRSPGQNPICSTVPSRRAAAPAPHQDGGSADKDTFAASHARSPLSATARSPTPDGSPSSAKPAPTGVLASGQSISAATGLAGDAMAWAITWHVAAAPAHSAVTYAVPAGSGCSRNVACVIRPSVPRDPANSLPMSYPATFLTTFPPDLATVPSAR